MEPFIILILVASLSLVQTHAEDKIVVRFCCSTTLFMVVFHISSSPLTYYMWVMYQNNKSYELCHQLSRACPGCCSISIYLFRIWKAGCQKVLDPWIQDPMHKTYREAQIWLNKRDIFIFRHRCSILRHKFIFQRHKCLPQKDNESLNQNFCSKT